MTSSHTDKDEQQPSKKKKWLWFIGLYCAGIIVVGGFVNVLRYFVNHLAQ